MSTEMKEVEVFIGPCSKYITGQGWTTEVPVEQIKAKGYQKSEEIKWLTEENRKLNNEWDNTSKYCNKLQKQVDELKELAKIKLEHERNWSKIQTKQAVKDTAKEIFALLKSSEYVDSENTLSVWAIEKIIKERYGVEVE